MRKIIMFNLISLDGFFEGENQDINWHNVDQEFNEFAVKQTAEFGGIIFGRKTYQLFESFWPGVINDPAMSEEDKIIAKQINEVEKIVFSKTLEKVTWNNTKLFREINIDEINKLKNEEDRDLVIFGSGEIVSEFAKLGLIDEYRIMINPIILDKGKPLFKNVGRKLKLKLVNQRMFKNGNVLLYYVQE